MRATPARVAAIYALVSGAWIVLSDLALALLPLDDVLQAEVGIVKGLGFVAVSTLVVFLLARSLARQADRARQATERALAADLDAARREVIAGRRLEHLVAEAPLSIVTTDAVGRVVTWNPAAERLWGIPAGQAVGKAAPWVFDDEREAFADLLAAVIAGARPIGEIRRRRRADGSPVLVRVSNARIDLPDGGPGVIFMSEDVTAQVATERALERTRLRLQGLHDLDRAILAAREPDELARAALDHLGRLVSVDRAAIILHDLEADRLAILAATTSPAISLSAVPAVVPLAAAAPLPDRLATASGPVLLDLAREPDLGPVWVRARDAGISVALAFPLRDPAGDPMGFLGLGVVDPATLGVEARETAAEIAGQLAIGLHQARLRERLAGREARLRTILEGAPNPILTVAPDAAITYANPAAERAFGAVDSLVGRSFLDLLLHDSRELLVDRLAAGFADPTASVTHHLPGAEAVRLDGRPFPVTIEVGPIASTGGPEAVITLVDLTEQAALEAQLAVAQRTELLGQFAGILAHDVRSYIQSIGWAAEGLLADLGPDDPRRRDAVLVNEGVAEARRMISSILDFARGGSAGGSTDLATHLDRLGGILARLLGPGVVFDADLAPGLPMVALAPTSVTQILVNLATNAAEAMPDGGSFRVTATMLEVGSPRPQPPAPATALAPGRYVRLVASDTGHGMDEAVARRAFQPFYSAPAPGSPAEEPATGGRGAGHGLGLASVYLLVTRAGGAVALASRPGGGTTITLDLPVADGAYEGVSA